MDAKKRKPVFKPNLSTHNDRGDQRRSESVSPRKRCISEREETIVDDRRPVRSTEDRGSSERRTSGSDSRKRSTPSTSEADQGSKVELKKSTLRSEITKILYKYNHDYITSKIVRTMLMKKFGADLTPHKKYIDNTIMELLEVIDNDPINLKSIPGRIFVDGKLSFNIDLIVFWTFGFFENCSF